LRIFPLGELVLRYAALNTQCFISRLHLEIIRLRDPARGDDIREEILFVDLSFCLVRVISCGVAREKCRPSMGLCFMGILGRLLPIFIDLLMDNPDREWGLPFYPVVE
jgi:hypothetical protein